MQKTYFTVTAVIFLLIAILHALRLVYGWGAVIGSWAVPMWFSWFGIIITLFLSFQGFGLSRKSL